MTLLDEILHECKNPSAYKFRKTSDLFVLKLKNDIITKGELHGNCLTGRMIFREEYKTESPYCGECCTLDVSRTQSGTKISISQKIFPIHKKLKHYADTEKFELSDPYIFETISERSFYQNELTIPYKTYFFGSAVCCTIDRDGILCGRSEFVCAIDFCVKLP